LSNINEVQRMERDIATATVTNCQTMTGSDDASRRRQPPPLPPLPVEISDKMRESHGFSSTAHWVIPNVIMQGSRPGFGIDASDDSALMNQVRALAGDGGCRTFVSLQAECVPEEGSALLDDGGFRKPNPKDLAPYAELASSVAKEMGGEGGDAPQFLYYGIVGMQTAQSVSSLSNAISDLSSRVKSGEGGAVYVHCGGGVGRAGLVCACLLGALYPTVSADEAMEYTTGLCYLRSKDRKEGGTHYSSPETEGQKKQVREFFERMRSGDK